MLGSQQLDRFDERGYLVVRGAVQPAEAARVRAASEALFAAGDDERVTNAWTRVPEVRRLAASPDLLQFASELLAAPAVPFQTLNFRVGTVQAPHADTIHFDTVPSGGVCAVWVALEDVGVDQGPVEVYPGSHRWRVETPETLGLDPDAFDVASYESSIRDLIHRSGVAPVAVEMGVGDVLVWSANLLHGGAPRSPGTTRWSQVAHYVRCGHVLTTPMRSRVTQGLYEVRTVVDVATGCVVPSGRSAPVVQHRPGRRRSRVGGPEPTAWSRQISDAVGACRRIRTRLAYARIARARS